MPTTDHGSPATGTSAPDDTPSFGLRAKAVNAYCRELFPPAEATAAAEQILASLSGGISDDRVLLQTTRTAAAERLLDRDSAEDRECATTFSRLAARANGTLNETGVSRLEQHLASCLICRAAELRSARAERMFSALLGLGRRTPAEN